MRDLTVIESPASLCIRTCREVERQILGALATNAEVVLNLSRTDVIDGAGIAVLLWTQALARRTGAMLRIVAPTVGVRTFLEHMDLVRDLEWCDSVDEVLQGV
jgi:anti-anti-sigma regulatory factor